MARAGSTTANDVTPVILYNAASDGGGVVSLYVKCTAASVAPCLVTAQPNCLTTEFITLQPGESITVRAGEKGQGGLVTVAILGSGGTTAVTWMAVAVNI